MPDRLELFTLGNFRIQHGEATAGILPTRKMRALLVYIALEPREHQREQLATLLWGEMDELKALANLRTALSTMQQDFADYLIINRRTVSTNPQVPIWVDVQHITAMIAQAQVFWNAQTVTHDGLPAPLAEQLEQALALYQGDFLSGFALKDSEPFNHWKLNHQQQIRTQVTEAIEHLIEEALGQRLYEDGLRRAGMLLQIDPLSESAHRQSVLLLTRAGRRNEALAHYDTYRKMIRQQQGVDPAPEVTATFEEILNGQRGSSSGNAPMLSLPAVPTPFVNRPTELHQIETRLRGPECRLLTLVGIGGAGKTRLAIQAMTQLGSDFRDGALFVPLESVKQADFLPSVLGRALGVTFQPNAPLRGQLIAELAPRNMLLVLDNFEHMLDGAELLSAILSACPHVKILVTSRERLNLQEEWLLSLTGMSIPTQIDSASNMADLELYSAVQLFVQVAQRVVNTFSLADNAPDVIRICQLVEGLPLGIELAASWTRFLTCRRIVEEIKRNLSFLRSNVKNVPERHRNMLALLEQSWQHLSDEEQAGLRRLSVFRGVFDLDAALHITGTTLPTLGGLIDDAMVRVMATDGYSGYSVHELLRRFSFEKLQAANEVEATVKAYCDYFIRWLERCQGLQISEMQALIACDRQYSNIRAALAWASEQRDVLRLFRLSVLVNPYWQTRGFVTEGRMWIAVGFDLGAADVPPSLKAAVLTCLGRLAWVQGDHDQARQSLEEGLALSRLLDDKPIMTDCLIHLALTAVQQLGYDDSLHLIEEAVTISKQQPDQLLQGRATLNLGVVLLEMCEYTRGRVAMEEALQTFEALGARELIAITTNNLGVAAWEQGDSDLALRYYERSLTINQDIGSKIGSATALANLGEAAQQQGDYGRALALYRESMRLYNDIGDKQHRCSLIENFARLALAQGQYQRSAHLLGAAAAQRSAIHAPWSQRDHAQYAQTAQSIQAALGQSAFDAEWTAGQRMTLAELRLFEDPE